MEITYGTHTVDGAKLPEASIRALLSRGLAHVLGNEVSSQVIAHFRGEAVKAHVATLDTDAAKAFTGETRKAFEKAVKVDSDSDEYQSIKAKFQAEALAEVLAGTIGETSARGPKVDPFTAKVNAIVKSELLTQLRTAKFWGGKKDPTLNESWTMNGVTYTFEQLLARRLAANKARIEKEAKAAIDTEARKKASIAKAVESGEMEF